MKLKAFVLLSRVFVLVLLGGAATNADVVTQAWSCPTICDSRVNGYDGAADTNHLIAVVKSIDGHTYTYTTGQTPDGLGGYMIAIWKFDESGHLDGDFPLVWYDTIPSKAYPVAIVVESTLPQAPIYVVGAYAHAGEGLNVVILKIDYLTIGGHAHITPPQTYNNSAQNGDDYPVAMTDVVNGNLWVAVASTGVGTGMDYLVLGVDPAGLSIFASARYNNSPSNKSDIPADIKATSVGFGTPSNTSVVITGTSFDNVTKNDIVTIEYTYLVGSCGLVQRPELRYSGLPGATTNEVATSLAITGSGVNYAGDCGAPMSKIFVCGYTNGTPSGTNDYLVIGYPRTGSVNVPWRTTASHPSGANGNDTANKIVLAGDRGITESCG